MNYASPLPFTRPRALVGIVRADASDPKALLAELAKTVDEMRATNERIGKVEAKVDPLDIQKINSMNEAISNLEAAIDEQAKQIAAARLGGAPGDMEPTNPEYVAAFKAHMRRGDVSAAMSPNRMDTKPVVMFGIPGTSTTG